MLEQQINQIISDYNHNYKNDRLFVPFVEIENWDLEDVHSTVCNMNEYILKDIIYTIIKMADLSICLTSPVCFIRDYRILYEEKIKSHVSSALSPSK